ncbi:MAG: hypothetical protein WD397_07625 [Wenzhouxiangellaceae bacterium]
MTMNDSELDRRLNALPREAEPAPGNWTEIDRRIRRRRWPALAAAVAALGGVVLIFLQPGFEPSSGSRLESLLSAEVVAMQAAAPEPLAVAAPDSAEALMAAWQENQNAIAQLELALQRNPGNQLLLKFLAEARMRQARLTRSIGNETSPNNERSMNL